MPAVSIFDGSAEWLRADEGIPDALRTRISEAELRGHHRTHHPGDDEHLNLFEGRLEPDSEVSAHAHAVDEIIYVVAGEMILGRQRLGPGASIHVPGMTLYQFRAGPEGLHFLNFRARHDTTFLTRQEYLDARGDREDA